MMVQKGKLIRATRGCYSDFNITGDFVALADFDPSEKLAEFLKLERSKDSKYYFEHYEFLAWLCENRLIEDSDVIDHLWHLGDYELDGLVFDRTKFVDDR